MISHVSYSHTREWLNHHVANTATIGFLFHLFQMCVAINEAWAEQLFCPLVDLVVSGFKPFNKNYAGSCYVNDSNEPLCVHVIICSVIRLAR